MGRLLWLADALRAEGLRVAEVAGWQDRGKPTMDEAGVMIHHTASQPGRFAAPSLPVCVAGRPDLPGPLCHVLIGRDSVCHVIAAGRANHAGVGVYPGMPAATSNSNWVGIEIENDGQGEPWSHELQLTAQRAAAAICRHKGWGSNVVIGHKEFAMPRGRKIDPAGISMSAFRAGVTDHLLGEEDDMTPQQSEQFADLVAKVNTMYTAFLIDGVMHKHGYAIQNGHDILARLEVAVREAIDTEPGNG